MENNFTEEFLEEFRCDAFTQHMLRSLQEGVSPYKIIELLIKSKDTERKSFHEAMIRVKQPMVVYSDDVLKWINYGK